MPASGRPLNYTTTITAAQTAGECQAILAASGAASVAVHYEDGLPAGLSFALTTPHGRRDFTLPVDVDGMRRVLIKAEAEGRLLQKRAKGSQSSREQATRVAWRVAKDWLEACLALIAAGMTTIDSVMLPYLVVADDGRTLWQAYREREQAAIEAGGPGA
jgi:hypothetical protein